MIERNWTIEEIEVTAWACEFKAGSPEFYQRGLAFALSRRLTVEIFFSTEIGENLLAIAPTDDIEFWLDAKPRKEDALTLCNEMG